VWLQARLSNNGAIGPEQLAYKNRMMRGSTASSEFSPSVKFDRAHTEGLLSALTQLAEGAPLPPTYDSDAEPESIVGRKIRVRWSSNEYYIGEARPPTGLQ
jgi:hypothetical protein